MKRIAMLLLGLSLTIGTIGCKGEDTTTPPATPPAGDAADPAADPVEDPAADPAADPATP
jgi:hypothetical protein